MPRFKYLAATSEGAGFQYYRVQTFAYTKASLFYPKVSGAIYSHDTTIFKLAKNSSSLILLNVLMNIDVTDPAGRYVNAVGGRNDTIITGSAGGFPIFYGYNVNVYSDATNVNFAVDVGNGSAVNDVTAPAITISGTVFFYVAPF